MGQGGSKQEKGRADVYSVDSFRQPLLPSDEEECLDRMLALQEDVRKNIEQLEVLNKHIQSFLDRRPEVGLDPRRELGREVGQPCTPSFRSEESQLSPRKGLHVRFLENLFPVKSDTELENEWTATMSVGRPLKTKSWREGHFFSKDMDVNRMAVRHADEDYFIFILANLESFCFPGWCKASLTTQGMLVLHGGITARVIPFLAIVLVVPAYCLLPLAGPFFLRTDPALRQKDDLHLDPTLHQEDQCSSDPNAQQCKVTVTRRDQLEGLGRIAFLGWLAWAPILHLLLGSPHEIAFFISIFPWFSLAWCAYSIPNKRLITACNQALGRLRFDSVESIASGDESGKELTFSNVMDILTNNEDLHSLYPTFSSREEQDQPYQMKGTEWLQTGVVGFVQLFCAVWPIVDSKFALWPSILAVTGVFALLYNGRDFAHALFRRVNEFENSLDEVRMFLFMSSSVELRRTQHTQEEFLQMLKRNVRRRKLKGEKQGMKKLDEVLDRMVTRNKNRDPEELPLKWRRLELNLTTLDGVELFNHLQGWVYANVVSERFELDTIVSFLVVMVLLAIPVASIPTFLIHSPPSNLIVALAVALFDSGLSLGFVVFAMNKCVDMNELLFKRTDRILATWRSHAKVPVDTFLKLWDKDKSTERIVKTEQHAKDNPSGAQDLHSQIRHGPMEVRANIDTARENLLLQEPQRILGMKVTPALRARLLTMLLGSLTTFAYNLAKKLFVGISLESLLSSWTGHR